MSYDHDYDAAMDQLAEWEEEERMDKYYEEEWQKWNDACNHDAMEQYYQDEKKCEKFTEHSAVNSRLSVDNEELKQDNKGQNNKCAMCGITGHYTRDCENDENFKQEVLDGCWTFLYCDYCGSEFFEESEHILHIESCSCHKFP